MDYTDDMFLYEEIMLLSLKDEEERIASGALYNYAVGGAVITDLLFSQRIEVDPFRDALIDEWLIKMSIYKCSKTVQDWVGGSRKYLTFI